MLLVQLEQRVPHESSLSQFVNWLANLASLGVLT